MTSEKRTETRKWHANTLYIPYYHSMTLPTVIHNACSEEWSDIRDCGSNLYVGMGVVEMF